MRKQPTKQVKVFSLLESPLALALALALPTQLVQSATHDTPYFAKAQR